MADDVLGVSWPVAVGFAAHQLGESLTISWKHPPCDQTNYIAAFTVTYGKLTDGNCSNIPPGTRTCSVLFVLGCRKCKMMLLSRHQLRVIMLLGLICGQDFGENIN